jgi:hypothetical protein
MLDLRSGAGFVASMRVLAGPSRLLLLHVCIGVSLATGAISDLPLFLRCTTYFMVAAFFVAFHVLVEYQQILFSTTDLDVLFWRPIGSRTLFLAACCTSEPCRRAHDGIAPGPLVSDLPCRDSRLWVGVVFDRRPRARVPGRSHGRAVYAWLLRVIRRERFQPP